VTICPWNIVKRIEISLQIKSFTSGDVWYLETSRLAFLSP
jgi:hypothetical protein